MRENHFSCNDYLRLTRAYLKNLSVYKQAVENLQQEERDMRAQLKGVSIKTVRFDSVGGGSGELTATEQAADLRLLLSKRVSDCRLEYLTLKNQCMRIELALKALPPEEKEAVELVYHQHFSYTAMADKLFLSERTCRRRLNQAVQKVAVMLFGIKAEQNVLFVS